MSTRPPAKPTFIHDQRIYVLDRSDGRKLSLKQALSLTRLPEYGAVNHSYSDWNRDEDKRDYWKTIDTSVERTEFLQQLGGSKDSPLTERRLLCITSTAGIGKTRAIEQAKFLRSKMTGHTVIDYRLDCFPNSVNSFWGHGSGDETHESVFKRIEKKLIGSIAKPKNLKTYQQGIESWLTHKISHGEVSLFIDELDQTDSINAIPRIKTIKSILEEFPTLHCMIAGRPYAVAETFWNLLFATSEDRCDDTFPWVFCCVGMFTKDQIRRSLGPKRAKRIFSLAGQLNLSPRTIEVLRRFPDTRFCNIKNLCDVYWESLQGTLSEDVLKNKKENLNPNRNGISAETYIEYASALAITMFLENTLEVQYHEIENDLLKRLRRIPRWQRDTSKNLDERRETIAKLNAGAIEFQFYHESESSVEWRDSTTRDFFAALWMVRYSTDAEQKRFIDLVPNRIRRYSYSNKYFTADSNDAWLFIASMPSGAFMFDSSKRRFNRWLRLIRAIFQPSDSSLRPTQVMWYAWLRLSELITDGTKLKPTKNIQDIARSIQQDFISEFENLIQTNESKKIINEDLLFVPITPLTRGHLKDTVYQPVVAGTPNNSEEIDRPYSISKYQITRRLYNLFDPNHAKIYELNYESYCKHPKCPVIDVNWYDAKMFSIWCKSRLLNEWEWEYACRSNKNQDAISGLKYRHNDATHSIQFNSTAWFAENSGLVSHVVGELLPNHFGVCDMLGNVFEWTEDCSENAIVAQVLRGGSFLSHSDNASKSFRLIVGPSHVGIDYGLRVARDSDRN